MTVKSTSKGIPSTVTERVSTEGMVVGSETDVCSAVSSSTANPELTLLDESELGKL